MFKQLKKIIILSCRLHKVKNDNMGKSSRVLVQKKKKTKVKTLCLIYREFTVNWQCSSTCIDLVIRHRHNDRKKKLTRERSN